jgi:hypothetical protein
MTPRIPVCVLSGYDTVELADGSKKEELLFKGAARLMGKTRRVEMFLTHGEDALVGTEILSGLRVTLDFPECRIRVKRRPRVAVDLRQTSERYGPGPRLRFGL